MDKLGRLQLLVMERLRWGRSEDEQGQGMVEYAFILALVALVVLLAVTVLGKQVNNTFSNISSSLNSAN